MATGLGAGLASRQHQQRLEAKRGAR
jgi:hypothetical protein